MSMLYPKYRFDSITQITAQDLRKMGVLGIAVDLDNTTAIDHTDIPLEGAVEWVLQMKQEGFKVLLLTNAKKDRARSFSKILGNIDYIGFSCKPLRTAYIRAKRAMGLKSNQVAMIGDQLFTDILGANLAGMVSIYVTPFEMEKRGGKSFEVRRDLEQKIFERMDAGVTKK
ncbi:MAG: YqeG family HAD IIIA-type phosphatase [Acutalibacteraceae bacterium]|jgi:HAD superfamily phosphatase (TIGR01668 family)|nr:YqeG family HAD IIIA-type phosphatase [Clostridiales bacterium]